MGTPPTGTVTFLFTDIEGSTELAQQYPDSMTSVLDRHDSILKNAIQSHNGYIFQIFGDAFCAAFQTVREALDAALAAERCLQAEHWSPATVRVRMGIATGSAQIKLQEDRPPDYSGYANLARVQRVMSVANGGQILLADASAALVRGELPAGVTLRDLGEHRLKSLINPERLWQVMAPSLPAEFPALRTLDAIPHNLPLQLTSFIGREHEMEKIKRLLESHRLVTLTGAGGTGKTRLALQTAADALDIYRDGVWLVELAAVSDPERVPLEIATLLCVREEPGRALLEVLKDFLNRKCLLIVLDNCEHLLEACGNVAAILLSGAQHIGILATSREALGIPGESIYPVHSLPVPAAGSVSAEAVAPYDAVRLFVDRAAAVLPDFHLTDHNASAVAQVCARLDGIPLALELAAARVKGLSVEQIAARLHDRFHLLTGGSRTALPRQRTLQATIDWSYKLLSEDERLALRRLSVFSGGWTLEAAESVCAGQGVAPSQVLDLQLRLIDKSLVTTNTQVSEPRYHMLEMIRQYAQEKLDDAGEVGEARTRHLRYFLELTERAEPEFLRRDSPQWLLRMDQERENLRAAMDYAICSGQPEEALKLFGSGFWLWVWQAPHSEGQKLAEAALAATPAASTVARGKALTGLGFCAHQQTDYSAARRAWEQALVIWEEQNDKWWQALVLSWYGNAVRLEDSARAFHLMREAVRLAREVNAPWILAGCLWLLGSNTFDQGNLAEGRTLLEESLALVQGMGDLILLDEVLLALGNIAEAEKDYPRALSLYRESREVARGTRDLIFISYFNLDLGRIMQIMGDSDQAAQLFIEALQRSVQLGKKSSLVEAVSSLGVVAHARGDPARAVRLMSAGRSLFDGLGTKLATDWWRRPWTEQHMAAARAQLGEEAFDALSREGQAMTVEQAVQYALSGAQAGK